MLGERFDKSAAHFQNERGSAAAPGGRGMIISAADRAAKVCAEIKRIFGKRLFLDLEFFDRLEDIICEALVEHEIDVRREDSVGQ
jgi:hypothetical protein